MRLLEETAFALEERAVVGRRLVSEGTADASMMHLDDEVEVTSYTERFLSSLIAFISIFLRPILTAVDRIYLQKTVCPGRRPWKTGSIWSR